MEVLLQLKFGIFIEWSYDAWFYLVLEIFFYLLETTQRYIDRKKKYKKKHENPPTKDN